MGGKSSSNSTTTTTTTTVNKSNSAAFNGDMTGHVVSGVENSSIVLSDHGAVKEALASNVAVSERAFDFGDKALDDAFDFGDKALGEAFSFGRDALEMSEAATDSALDVARNLSLDSDAHTVQSASNNMMWGMIAVSAAFAAASVAGRI